MRRILPLVAVCLFAVASPCHAQWFSTPECEGNWWKRYWAGFKENNQWPKQWVGYDRQAVCMPLNLMAEKGWHKQNLIGSFHFDQANGELNQAGQHKVRFIMTQQLPERRTIFVERGTSPVLTAQRIDAVQQFAAAMVPVGELPMVAESNMILEGWPAEDADATLQNFAKSRPTPRLPASSSEASNTGTISP